MGGQGTLGTCVVAGDVGTGTGVVVLLLLGVQSNLRPPYVAATLLEIQPAISHGSTGHGRQVDQVYGGVSDSAFGPGGCKIVC